MITKKIKHICVIRNDRMGDMILTLPVLKELKQKHSSIKLDVICSSINGFLCKEANL